MKATITSTSHVVTIDAVGYPDNRTQARVWEGVTEGGVAFTAYIPVVQVRKGADCSVFDREFTEHVQPSKETTRAIGMRFVL